MLVYLLGLSSNGTHFKPCSVFQLRYAVQGYHLVGLVFFKPYFKFLLQTEGSEQSKAQKWPLQYLNANQIFKFQLQIFYLLLLHLGLLQSYHMAVRPYFLRLTSRYVHDYLTQVLAQCFFLMKLKKLKAGSFQINPQLIDVVDSLECFTLVLVTVSSLTLLNYRLWGSLAIQELQKFHCHSCYYLQQVFV